MSLTVEELKEICEDVIERGRGHYSTGLPECDVKINDDTRSVQIVDTDEIGRDCDIF